MELAEICRLVAQSKLSERKHLEALPAAQFCLRCSVDVYGPSTVQLVPAYLLLAEANMGEEGAQNGSSAQMGFFLLPVYNVEFMTVCVLYVCICVCVHLHL